MQIADSINLDLSPWEGHCLSQSEALFGDNLPIRCIILTLWRPESEGPTGDHCCLLIYYGNHLWRWAGENNNANNNYWLISARTHKMPDLWIFFEFFAPTSKEIIVGWCFSWYERLIASDLTHIIKSEIFYHHPSQENWNWKHYLEENCFP